MDINENENSAIQLKYAISNNVDKFNYTYEYSDSYKDFNYNADKIGETETDSTGYGTACPEKRCFFMFLKKILFSCDNALK